MASVTEGAAAALGPKGGRKKKEAPAMHIEPAEHGAYIVRHSPREGNDPTSQRQQTYALSSKASLLAHIAQHAPDDPPETDQPMAGAE